MFSKITRRPAAYFINIIKNKETYVLLGILALAAYLRIWDLHHIFNAVHDYDQGAYALGSRFISEGYLPYRDFVLVHPPLHEIVLAGVFKLCGYNYFYGVYLSVIFSLASVVLAYLVGKKLNNSTTAVFAALLVAVSPEMVYWGRRVVQESLGIFLILLAINFAIDFIKSNKPISALCCGLALGLSAATKYTFIPPIIAIIVAVIFVSMKDKSWSYLGNLGFMKFWGSYLCFGIIFWSIIMVLRWSLGTDIPVPFLDSTYLTVKDVAVTCIVFLIPAIPSFKVAPFNIPIRQWCSSIWKLRNNAAIWLLMGGSVVSFFLVTGYFWARAPKEFLKQTFLMQANRAGTEFPSFVGLVRISFYENTFLKIAGLILLLSIPVLLLLLKRKDFSKSACFISVGLIVSFLLCQGFYQLPRYYSSLLLFMILGISYLMPPLQARMFTLHFNQLTDQVKYSLLALAAIFVLFTGTTIVLLTNYTGYDVLGGGRFASNEEEAYEGTLKYLEDNGARKVFATNPIFPALSPKVGSTLEFDTFALLWLEQKSAKDIIQTAMEDGVDYIIIDAWLTWWGPPSNKETLKLQSEIHRKATLVKVIEPDSLCRTEIYRLSGMPEKQ